MHRTLGGRKLRGDRVPGPWVSVMPRVRNHIQFVTGRWVGEVGSNMVTRDQEVLDS